MWKINAGRRSKFASDFLQKGIVAIGWSDAGSMLDATSRDEVYRRVSKAFPNKTDRQNEVASNQIWRFLREVKIGDRVTTYDPVDRIYALGRVTGEPLYSANSPEALPTRRAVVWDGSVSRDALSKRSKGKLGAILTLFLVDRGAAAELEALAQGQSPDPEDVSTGDGIDDLSEAEDPFASLEELAIERIKDRLLRLGWDEMQEMVAALLRALGYRTIVSPAGPDRGKDIIASRDGFGFEPPRIVVEVKHRKDPMGAPEIRAFLGGRHPEDRGLYVSTGGFSREAHFEAERASTVTHLMTLDGLAQAIVDNYDSMDERGRSLLPLTRLYWPVDSL